jgi:serine/threonine-protein kinase
MLVVHRDLKPSNILVTGEGRVRHLDFGIAKLLESDTETVATRTDARVMTPEHASPEQIQGAPVTTATDVHGLGILLYELLTGRHPYRRERTSRYEVERAVLEIDPVPPSRALTRDRNESADANGPSVHGSRRLRCYLDTIVLTALRKNPGQRYGSTVALAADVRRHSRAEPIRSRGNRRRR